MKRLVMIFSGKIAIIAILWWAPASFVLAATCLIPGATPIAFGTTFAVGPSLYWFLTQSPDSPGILNAIRQGRDAWDSSNATNYIGDWSGVVTGSECANDTGQRQLGAWNFNDPNDPNYNCLALVLFPTQLRGALAYADNAPGCRYTNCNTGSISVNLRYSFSANPLAGQYDIQSLAAHEFGHVLGLAHKYSGDCVVNFIAPQCVNSIEKETMAPTLYPGPEEICQRDITPNDALDANTLYQPPPPASSSGSGGGPGG